MYKKPELNQLGDAQGLVLGTFEVGSTDDPCIPGDTLEVALGCRAFDGAEFE